MIYKYAIYCSGNATRILKFYEKYSLEDFPLKFLIYDGEIQQTKKRLTNAFQNKVIFYKNNETFSKKIQSENFSVSFLDLLLKNSVDYVFCFGEKILKPPLINVFKNKIINFHPSLLPLYPGLNAIDQALENNEQFLGNTAHFIDAGIDTGPIIMQTKIEKDKFINYDSVLDLQIQMLFTIWHQIENNGFNSKNI